MTLADNIIRDAAASPNPEAFLRERGWSLRSPSPPQSPPGLGAWRRNHYHAAAVRKGWNGGTIPERWLTSEEIAECDHVAAEDDALDRAKPIYRNPAALATRQETLYA